MDKTPQIYIVYYMIPRGRLDTSAGTKRSMVMLAFSVADAKRTFVINNQRARVIGIDRDTRQVGISGEVLDVLLTKLAPGYMKSVQIKENMINDQIEAGRQYNSFIDNNENYLLTGI